MLINDLKYEISDEYEKQEIVTALGEPESEDELFDLVDSDQKDDTAGCTSVGSDTVQMMKILT